MKSSRPPSQEGSLCRQAMLTLSDAIEDGRLKAPLAQDGYDKDGGLRDTWKAAPLSVQEAPAPPLDDKDAPSAPLRMKASPTGMPWSHADEAPKATPSQVEEAPTAMEVMPSLPDDSWLDDLLDMRVLRQSKLGDDASDADGSDASTAIGTPRLTCMIPDIVTARTAASSRPPTQGNTPRLSKFEPTPKKSTESSQITPRLLSFMPDAVPSPALPEPWITAPSSWRRSTSLPHLHHIPSATLPSDWTRPGPPSFALHSLDPLLVPAMPAGSAPQAVRWLSNGMHPGSGSHSFGPSALGYVQPLPEAVDSQVQWMQMPGGNWCNDDRSRSCGHVRATFES